MHVWQSINRINTCCGCFRGREAGVPGSPLSQNALRATHVQHDPSFSSDCSDGVCTTDGRCETTRLLVPLMLIVPTADLGPGSQSTDKVNRRLCPTAKGLSASTEKPLRAANGWLWGLLCDGCDDWAGGVSPRKPSPSPHSRLTGSACLDRDSWGAAAAGTAAELPNLSASQVGSAKNDTSIVQLV
jgi:hypothetical protein